MNEQSFLFENDTSLNPLFPKVYGTGREIGGFRPLSERRCRVGQNISQYLAQYRLNLTAKYVT